MTRRSGGSAQFGRAVALALWFAGSPAFAAATNTSAPPVALLQDRAAYILSNGVVTARIQKTSGDLVSLKYQGLELLARGSGHPFGYWSHAPGRGMMTTNVVTIDPLQNGGARAEVAVKGIYAGGERAGAGTACDLEIRYTLARGDSGVYTWSVFTHRTNYPATSIGEARFGVKLNPEVFDFMTIDARRRKVMPKPEDWDQGTELNLKEARRLNTGRYQGQVEHKYDYSAMQSEIPAYGWSSTEHHLGLWFINPSIEYLSGGVTKVELTGHLDNNEGGAPTLLNYWRGSHYGGSVCAIGDRESWSKVIGPFLIYCNRGADHEQMWRQALARAAEEAKAWPYDWVGGADYPHRYERGAVEGRIVLNEPTAPKLQLTQLRVGLAAPDYVPPSRGNRGVGSGGGGEDENNHVGEGSTDRSGSRPGNRSAGPALPALVDWQLDAKFYQFWVRGDEHGRFSIPNVRPGTYTLHAIADGIPGEAVVTKVNVRPGRTLDLGTLQWTPARLGRTLWEIGVPDRSAAEFRHGDHYWQWGLYYQYTNDFPADVRFVIGKSDWSRDWNYAQLPHSGSEGSTWSVVFPLTNAPTGRAALRLGIAAISLRGGIEVSVNGQVAGVTSPLPDTATIRRDGIRGYWSERVMSFDAALLRSGENVLKLTIPPGPPTSGVEYDYVRLELIPLGKATEEHR